MFFMLLGIDDAAGVFEDAGEHCLGEAAGLGVLLAGVVAADQGGRAGELGTVGEAVFRFLFALDG